jgi:hypothetical protein
MIVFLNNHPKSKIQLNISKNFTFLYICFTCSNFIFFFPIYYYYSFSLFSIKLSSKYISFNVLIWINIFKKQDKVIEDPLQIERIFNDFSFRK